MDAGQDVRRREVHPRLRLARPSPAPSASLTTSGAAVLDRSPPLFEPGGTMPGVCGRPERPRHRTDRRGREAREPRLPAQLNRVLRVLRELRGRVHVPVADGRHLLAVHPRRRARAGPAYIWLTFIPLIGMLFVALVFGEFASHYPVAGALYQYSKFSVGPGVRLVRRLVLRDRAAGHGGRGRHRVGQLRRPRSRTTGSAANLDPTDHRTILLITLVLLAIQTTLNITGAKVMGRVAQFGVVRRDPRDARHRDHPRDPRLPPRPRLPVLDRRARSTPRPTSGSTSAATG